MEKWMQDRWQRVDVFKKHIFKTWISLWPRNSTFLSSLECNSHVCTHILQPQSHPPREMWNLFYETCRLSVSHGSLEVVLPLCVFHTATGIQLLVWSLLLASIHPSVPSVMLSLCDTCSRLSPEGRLTRGWCTLAFLTSDWNVYTSIFCRWKIGK